MQASFRPNNSTLIVVSNTVSGVMLEVYEVIQNLTSADVERNPINPSEKQLLCLALSRPDARSIASAMMGAAAKQD